MKRDPVARFVEKVEIGFCWLYIGATDSNGYSKFYDGRRTVLAHRFAWDTFVGTPIDGLDLDHVYAAGCRNTNCVNPDHLDPVSHPVNMKRGAFGRRTHCPLGHEYTSENTYRNRNGHRRCRTCLLARQGIRRAAQRQARPPRQLPERCKHGHEFTPENTHITPDGWRSCRACKARNSHASRIRRLNGEEVAPL